MGLVPTHAKPSRGVAGEVREIFEKRLFLWIVATTDENGFMLGKDFIKEKAKEIAETGYSGRRVAISSLLIKRPRWL